MKSLAQKTDFENAFFVKFMYVTICDLHGHRRSQVLVRNERLYMSSYLRIIVTIGLSGIEMTRYDVLDNFCFDLKYLAKKMKAL